jgi:DNA replicative helicase MCM subunit Mcm2 (Cdc46/Mcm family)
LFFICSLFVTVFFHLNSSLVFYFLSASGPQQPLKCTNPNCGNRLRWQLDRQASRFVDWQKLRVQESTDEIPAGRCIFASCICAGTVCIRKESSVAACL